MRPLLTTEQLCASSCLALEGTRGGDYTTQEIDAQLTALPLWACNKGFLERQFAFKNYYSTMSFVNALAWVVHTQDHHPELAVTYNKCLVKFNTHSVNGISVNDFICAAKADALFAHHATVSSL
jgi:4a-hydroxytetrahydrobiopterin dehydratase